MVFYFLSDGSAKPYYPKMLHLFLYNARDRVHRALYFDHYFELAIHLAPLRYVFESRTPKPQCMEQQVLCHFYWCHNRPLCHQPLGRKVACQIQLRKAKSTHRAIPCTESVSFSD